jgi:peptidoglycan/LPS O-acetylase OafA/YrhL
MMNLLVNVRMSHLFQTFFKLEPIPRSYSYWIDFLRGVAALAVLFGHYGHFGLAHPEQQPFYSSLAYLYSNGGSLSVWLFWVISGFVFAQTYLFKPSTGRNFFINRLARLYPLHFLTLIVVALLQLVSTAMTGATLIYENNNWYHFILNLLFIPAWGFQAGRSFNGPVWSVSVELLIYVIFWFSIAFVVKRGILAALGFSALFISMNFYGVPGSAFWMCGFFFFLGVATYIVNAVLLQETMLRLLTSCALALVAALWYHVGDSSQLVLSALLFPALVLLCAIFDTIDVLGIGKKVSHFGNLSYGMYLIHIPVQLILLLGMFSLGFTSDIARSPWFLGMFIFVVITLAHYSFVYFESTMRVYVRKMGSSK